MHLAPLQTNGLQPRLKPTLFSKPFSHPWLLPLPFSTRATESSSDSLNSLLHSPFFFFLKKIRIMSLYSLLSTFKLISSLIILLSFLLSQKEDISIITPSIIFFFLDCHYLPFHRFLPLSPQICSSVEANTQHSSTSQATTLFFPFIIKPFGTVSQIYGARIHHFLFTS